MDGFLLIHKPAGLTSFDCVMLIKKQLQVRAKVGHAGTLDAFASGLLIVALGRSATACIKEIMVLDKRYRATALFGSETDTLDPTGVQIDYSKNTPSIESLQSALDHFRPSYWQVPPLFSALKHKGERLSDLKRENVNQSFLEQIAQRKKNLVDIHQATIISYQQPELLLDVYVSHGTYIRSFVRDLAHYVGSCGHVRALTRTDIGPFKLEHAIDPYNVSRSGLAQWLIPVEEIRKSLEDYKRITNDKKCSKRLQDYKSKKRNGANGVTRPIE